MKSAANRDPIRFTCRSTAGIVGRCGERLWLMRVDVFGIRSCDACRKARGWLAEQPVDFRWIDLRESAPSRAEIERWLGAVGAEVLVNRRSTTWRALDEKERPALDSPAVVDLLLEHPTLIKRPLFERGDELRAGFGEAQRRWLVEG